MKKEIVINGRVYPTREITFNAICQLEDMGIPMADVENKSLSFVRAYAAMCMGKKAEQAGEELEAHVLGGGSVEDITSILGEAIEESGFFQALSARAKETDSESKEQTA